MTNDLDSEVLAHRLAAMKAERDEQCRLKHDCIGELERLRTALNEAKDALEYCRVTFRCINYYECAAKPERALAKINALTP